MNSTKKNMKTLKNLRNKFTSNWGMRSVLFFGAFLVLLLIASCGKDEAATEDLNSEDSESELTIAQLIATSGDFDVYADSTTETESGEAVESNEDIEKSIDGSEVEVRWVCTEREVDVLGGSADFPLYNPTASVIWPGNIIEGKTINNALPKAITVKRGVGKITYSLKDGNTNATSKPIVIDEGTVNQEINDIVRGNTDVASKFSLAVKKINSKSQLAFEMGLSVETLTTKVDGDFSYNSSEEVNSVLVELKQEYYTMSFVTPTSVADFFDPSVTATELATRIGPDKPAAFIKSVTYGRIFYMLFESTSSAEELSLALSGEYNGLTVAGEFKSKRDVYNEFNEVNVKVIAFGGNAEATLEATAGINSAVDLETVIKSLATAGTIGSGKALSYEVYSLKDPDERLTSNLATKYTIKSCTFRGILAPDVYQPLVDIFEDGIGAAFQLTGTAIVLYNKTGTKYAYFNVGSGKAPIIWNVSDIEGAISSNWISTGPVGAAVRMRDGRIHIFNLDGTQFLKFRYNPTNPAFSPQTGPIGPIGNIEEYPDGSPHFFPTGDYYSEVLDVDDAFPFPSDGIDAAIQYEHLGNETSEQYLFAKDGTSYVTLFDPTLSGGNSSATWYYTGVKLTSDFLGGNSFDSVGAATLVDFGGATTEEIYFNGEGNQMIIKKYNVADPNNPNISGPFYIN
tara:strand:+ start:155 stop:2203 length:2049 start_codon:yes stop_codon:yes gene_type:complete